MQSAARKKALYNTIRDDRVDIQLSIVFVLIPIVIGAHFLYLDETGNVNILRRETVRYLSVGVILVVLYTLVHLLFGRYSKSLEVEYRENIERIGSPWAFRVFLVVVAIECIGWIVFSSMRQG